MTKAHPVESDVKREIKKLLATHGWFHFMPPANTFGKVGISDILALRRGRFMAIEVKLKKVTGTANQELFMKQVRDNGGIALLVHQGNLPKFKALLERLDAAGGT